MDTNWYTEQTTANYTDGADDEEVTTLTDERNSSIRIIRVTCRAVAPGTPKLSGGGSRAGGSAVLLF